MDDQFVTFATTDDELHFDDIASLDGLAELKVSQVDLDFFGFMRRHAPFIDGLHFLFITVESPSEATFLVSLTLVLPLHIEFEVFAGASRKEFPLGKEIVALSVQGFGKLEIHGHWIQFDQNLLSFLLVLLL